MVGFIKISPSFGAWSFLGASIFATKYMLHFNSCYRMFWHFRIIRENIWLLNFSRQKIVYLCWLFVFRFVYMTDSICLNDSIYIARIKTQSGVLGLKHTSSLTCKCYFSVLNNSQIPITELSTWWLKQLLRGIFLRVCFQTFW